MAMVMVFAGAAFVAAEVDATGEVLSVSIDDGDAVKYTAEGFLDKDKGYTSMKNATKSVVIDVLDDFEYYGYGNLSVNLGEIPITVNGNDKTIMIKEKIPYEYPANAIQCRGNVTINNLNFEGNGWFAFGDDRTGVTLNKVTFDGIFIHGWGNATKFIAEESTIDGMQINAGTVELKSTTVKLFQANHTGTQTVVGQNLIMDSTSLIKKVELVGDVVVKKDNVLYTENIGYFLEGDKKPYTTGMFIIEEGASISE
ncbi:MAG: hypothetical protein IJ469_03950, partial [Candidatus Methanomethylophilaceae archaeon]|nr:hypothetical protein [Candidatus Methanomethylophilaceae archaeon]